MTTKLFKLEDIKKFFEILRRLDRRCSKVYQRKGTQSFECQKEIFVKRTIAKWFNGKHIILYDSDGEYYSQYKKYLTINHISYVLGHGEEIEVYLYDYSRPMSPFNTKTISFNDLLYAEGEWCDNNEKHLEILKLFKLDILEKEYVFKAYDWTKYPKRVINQEKAREKITTSISFKAKTEKEAYDKRKLYIDSEDEHLDVSSEIIEIKEI